MNEIYIEFNLYKCSPLELYAIMEGTDDLQFKVII